MSKLHQIEEVRVYCGPAALMAITGLRLPRVREVINEIRGRRPSQGVIGLPVDVLRRALSKLNVAYSETEVHSRMTLERFVLEEAEPNVRYIVQVTGHYVSVLNGLVIDNHYRFGTDIQDGCKWRGKHVTRYFRINGVYHD